MIDFRYHLVSLVSVFLALAVGIVLGAGPLKGQIGDTLANSVEQLRQEKDQLHDQVATATTSIANRDAFLEQVTPQLVAGQLTGRSVVVVSLAGVDSKTVSSMVEAVDAAGGTVTGQVAVASDWVEAGGVTARDKALAKIAQKLPATSQVSGDATARLNTYLARSLVGTGDTGSLARGSTIAPAVLDALKSNDLIDTKGDLTALAGSAVVLAPAVDTATAGNPTPTPVGVTSYLPLVSTLDTTGGGTVVTGPASSATAGGFVAAVRKDESVVKIVSTVDDGMTPAGEITTVAALREQAAGGVGQYGFGSGAGAVLPATVTAGGSAGGANATSAN
ncbi:copper transporter [Spongisporangium articulatum]|uniref:Copper transporter n=1 Tax=Spongisporangium articulatum TaxID=3362603 RepID=A0ABW8AU04_9ACTN